MTLAHSEFRKQEALGKIKPHPIEVFFGYCAILVFAIQAVYKLSSGKGIFLLNPCHVVLVNSHLFSFNLLTPSRLADGSLRVDL